MALITLTSASGSPGVTTSALALALAAPRPTILVEADPTGGSALLAGYMRGQQPHDKGLVNLVMAHRTGTLEQTLREVLIPLPESKVDLIAGLRSHTQAATAEVLWDSLAQVLRGLDTTGTDVIVDAGRLGLEGAPMALHRAADLVLLTTRTTLPALSAARSWARSLRAEFVALGAAQNLGLLLIGEGRPYSAREVRKALELPVVASLAHDQVSAETYSLGARPARGFERRSLPRSTRAAVSAIWDQIERNRARLAPGSLVTEEETSA